MTTSNNPHVPSHLVGADGEIMGDHMPWNNSNSSNASTNDEQNETRQVENNASGNNHKPLGLFQEESPTEGKSQSIL